MTCAQLPIQTGGVTSPFGWRQRPSGADLHTGLDLGAPEGTAVFATLPGRVVASEPNGKISGYGDVIVLEHGPGLYSLSAHLSRRFVAPGAAVAAGEPIGEVGRTAGTSAEPAKMFGRSGAHLHLEFLSRWPPSGRDLDRLDPAAVLAELGVQVPARGPLRRTCAPSSVASEWGTMPPTAPSSSSGGLLVLAAIFALARTRNGKAR